MAEFKEFNFFDGGAVMKKKIILTAMMSASLICSSIFAMSKPVTIQNQGSFMAGGKIIEENGKTLH